MRSFINHNLEIEIAVNRGKAFLMSHCSDTRLAKRGRAVSDMIADFLETGAALLVGTPRTPNTVGRLRSRLGPIREVAFARVHDVVVDPGGYNAAHTALPLPPHNDLASLS